MTEPTASARTVHQLRIVLRGVSPLVWRRLLVPSDTTISELHALLQLAFGWSDDHLHRFVVHGREYGMSRPGGIGFRDDARRVRLDGLGLRPGERFVYEYDFFDRWRHDVRVEQVTPAQPGRAYPVCTGGRRAAPPEGCGGAWAFLEWRQHHHLHEVATRLAELLADDDTLEEHRKELLDLCRWLVRDRFDRRALNRALAAPAAAERSVA